MFSIVDMTSEMIERKLQSLAIREQTVLACWPAHGEGFQIRWDLFASRFDDFWYLGGYYMTLSVILEKQNRWAEANANAKKAMEVFVEVMGKDHPFTIEKQKYQDRLDKMAENGGA